MKLLKRIGSYFRKSTKRSFEAGQFNRLTQDLSAALLSPDAALFSNLVTLRNRARTLERNNPVARKFLRICEVKIVGCGIGLQSKVKLSDATLDKPTNSLIETAWSQWGKRKHCTVDGLLSWPRVQRLVVRTVARDGEVLLRLVRNFPHSKYKFAVQVIEPDHLDETYNDTLANGHEVRMGVELDGWRRPIAFYLLTRHPGEVVYAFSKAQPSLKRERVDARDIVYVGLPDRAGQTRAVSWMSCVMLSVNHLVEYEKAEVVAARMQANSNTFFEKTVPENLEGVRTASGSEVTVPDGFQDGELIQESSPGQAVELPLGFKAVLPPPTHPNPAFAEARKAFLRSAASGLGVAYSELGSDYKDANYSSMRAEALVSNPGWKTLQQWVIEDLCEIVFEAWLETAIMSGALPFRIADFDRLNQPDFKAPGFAYVDPVKDLTAQVMAIDNGFKSRRSVVAEQGGDLEDVYDDIAADEALAIEKGITIPSTSSKPAAAASAQPVDDEDEEDDDKPEDEKPDEKEDDDEEEEARKRVVIVNSPPRTGKRFVRFQRDQSGRMRAAEVTELDGSKIKFDQNGKLRGAEVVAKDGRVIKTVKLEHDAEGRLTGASVSDESTP
jgi:lambda family phage portal protein